MLNFHFTSPRTSVLAYPCGMGERTRVAAEMQFRKILLRCMRPTSQKDVELDELSQSELNALRDFTRWSDSVSRIEFPEKMSDSAFIYFNCNTGDHVVLIGWCGYGDFGITTDVACDC